VRERLVTEVIRANMKPHKKKGANQKEISMIL
jgi:hypothetical protein